MNGVLAAGGSMSMVSIILVYVVIIGGMWFLLMRPQKKEQKRIQAMLSTMEVGDTVLTTSGFYGVIIDITDDDVIDRMDLLMPCLYAYCPGCRVLNEQVTSEHPETLCTPALEINGTLRFWGVPASDDALRQALSSL